MNYKYLFKTVNMYQTALETILQSSLVAFKGVMKYKNQTVLVIYTYEYFAIKYTASSRTQSQLPSLKYELLLFTIPKHQDLKLGHPEFPSTSPLHHCHE